MEEDGLQELRFIEFVRVEESTGGLVAKFTFYLSDGFYDEFELSEDAAPKTQTFDGRKYLTDEAFYNSLISGGVEWEPLVKE